MLSHTTKKAIRIKSEQQHSDKPLRRSEIETPTTNAGQNSSPSKSNIERAWQTGLKGNDVFIKAHSKSLLERFGSQNWVDEGHHVACWMALPLIAGGVLGVAGVGLGLAASGIGALTGLYTLNLGLNGIWLGAAGALGPVASVFKLAASGLAAIDRKWIRKTKVTEEVSRDEIEPVLQAFDRATPYGKAFMALWLQEWKNSLKRGRDLLPGAETQISERIAEAALLPESVRSSAQRVHELFSALHGLRGKKQALPKVTDIRRALKKLEPEERESLKPLLSELFFADNRPKLPMEDDVCQGLAEEIYGAGSEQASAIILSQLAFDAKGEAKVMDREAIETLEETLGQLSPEQGRSQKELLRRAFFKKERIQVAMAADLATRLWQATAEEGPGAAALAGIAKMAVEEQINRIAFDEKGRPQAMNYGKLVSLEEKLNELKAEDRDRLKAKLREAFFKGERNVTSMTSDNSLKLWSLTATS